MTATEKAALERRIDELCAEVERLRADQAHWELGNCPSCPNVADLQEALEQNAKLRELARDLYRCSDPCNDCPHYNDSNDGFYCDLGIGWKARRMRELGIEVE